MHASDDDRTFGRYIWTTYVPRSGQSTTVQGELLRANEKLRDEACRNGNMNWDEGHEKLARYLLETLTGSRDVAEADKSQLRADIARIMDYQRPYTQDDLYDRVERVLLGWCRKHPEPVPRAVDPSLFR